MTAKVYSAERPAGREHIPTYPKAFIALRIVQLVLGVLILALAAYAVSVLAADGPIFLLCVALFTLIITIYYIVAAFSAPKIYNYWAALALDIFMVIMWLSSFALLASAAASLFAVTTYYDYSSGNYYQGNGLTALGKTYASVLAAAAGIGAIEFVLFLVTLIMNGISLHRHRAAGLHSTPGKAATPPSATAAAAPTVTGEPKTEYPMQPQAAYQGPAPEYQHQVPQQQQQQQQQYPIQQQHPVQQQLPEHQQQQYAAPVQPQGNTFLQYGPTLVGGGYGVPQELHNQDHQAVSPQATGEGYVPHQGQPPAQYQQQPQQYHQA